MALRSVRMRARYITIKKNVLTSPLASLILIIYILSYPKAVSDSMQKEIRHKTNKKKEEMNRKKTSTLLWSFL